MNAIFIEIIVALSLAGAGALATWEHMHKEVKAARLEATTAQEALKVTQATLALRETARVATASAGASATRSLQHSFTAPVPHTWALTPVPKEVQNALCATVACSPSEPASGVPVSAASSPAP